MLLLLLQIASFWPIWIWYYQRTFDYSDEPWGLVALVTCLALLSMEKICLKKELSFLLYPLAPLVVYILFFSITPMLIKAAMAVTSLGLTLYIGLRRKENLRISAFSIAHWGLLFLSLPILASLQFYLGYPLRVFTAEITLYLLRLPGFLVIREGVVLRYGEIAVSVDAPCSGIKMLWVGIFLALSLAAMRNYSTSRTRTLLFGSILGVIIANISRASSLFFLESELILAPKWFHDAAGIAVFSVFAISLLLLTREKVTDV